MKLSPLSPLLNNSLLSLLLLFLIILIPFPAEIISLVISFRVQACVFSCFQVYSSPWLTFATTCKIPALFCGPDHLTQGKGPTLQDLNHFLLSSITRLSMIVKNKSKKLAQWLFNDSFISWRLTIKMYNLDSILILMLMEHRVEGTPQNSDWQWESSTWLHGHWSPL